MKTKLVSLVLAAGIELASGFHTCVLACGGALRSSLDTLTQQAISKDKALASSAIAKLRAMGPEGLEALLNAHAVIILQHQAEACASSSEDEENAWKKVKAALDAVSGQCDCYASHLYWYTDFEKAKAAAKAAGKPLLSLRLLGNLDEEYSCANSRFFRTTLYPNEAVSQYLRQHFILHWQSVRPVPKITIDFGDGRKIERTITGNSVHYILDAKGEPVDALPGLYGPKAFLNGLAQAEQAALACAGLRDGQKKEYLGQYHRWCRAAITAEWEDDLAKAGLPFLQPSERAASAGKAPIPTAIAAGRLAVSKSFVEAPMLKSLQPGGGVTSVPGRSEIPDETWEKIASLHSAEAQLDTVAKELIRSKYPGAFAASQAAVSKRLVENPFLAACRNLQRSIAEDTVRNEFLLHAQIHDWFVQGTAPEDLDRLNAKVYAELFLMPESDPWLGLVPSNTFSGLPDNGLVEARR